MIVMPNGAKRKKQLVLSFIETILTTHWKLDTNLSSINNMGDTKIPPITLKRFSSNRKDVTLNKEREENSYNTSSIKSN